MNKLFLEIEERIKKINCFRDDGEVAEWLHLKKSNYSQRKGRGSIPYNKITDACERDKVSYNYIVHGKGSPHKDGLREVNLMNNASDDLSIIEDVSYILKSEQLGIISALKKNVHEFRQAVDDAKELKECKELLKDMQKQIDGLNNEVMFLKELYNPKIESGT